MNFSSLISNKMLGVKASAIREIFKVAADPSVISFAGGVPAPETYPVEDIKEICQKVLTNEPNVALSYGLSEGYIPLKQLVLERMQKNENISSENQEIIIVSGSQQGCDLTAKVLLNEGDGVVCEEPSFIGCLNTFRTYNAKLYGVPMKEDGMDLVALEETLKNNPNIKLIYTIPTFQNPSGITSSLAVRKGILELAQKYNVLILEDNPYGELRFSGEKLPTIKSMDTTGHVVYLGSFSKVFSPGLRLAYLIFDKGLIEKMTVAKQATDVHTNVFSQMVAAEYLAHYDIDSSIEKARQLYKHRCEFMLSCMDKYFPDKVTYTRPEGGIFIWVTCPKGTDTGALMKEAISRKVAFVPGNAFMTDVDAPSHCFRLNYSTMSDEKIETGIRILGELLAEKL